MTNRPSVSPSQDSPTTAPAGCLLRVLCFLLGPAAMAMSAVAIAQGRGWRLGAADGVYAGIALVLIVLRFVDIRFFRGTTGTGKPAGLRDVVCYAAVLIPAGLAIWAAAHGVACYAG